MIYEINSLFNTRLTVNFTIHIRQKLFTEANAHPQIVCDKPKVEIPSKHRTKVGIFETNAGNFEEV